MSKIYPEILDEARQKVFERLSAFKQDGYLAGGTALAMQIKHRRSVDFDIFTDKSISNSLKIKVKKIFGPVDYYVDTGDQISFHTQDNISITLVWYYYKRLFPLVPTASLALASFQDIMADKAHTIGRRGVWRDYVDFYLVLKNKYLKLDQIIDLAKRKFGGEFNESLFLEQLTYYGDVDIVPVDFIGRSTSTEEIKSYLKDQAEKYLRKVLG